MYDENVCYHDMMKARLILLFVLATSATASIWATSDPTAVHLAGSETIIGSKTFTNTTTFSDPTKTLLLGASAVPDISGTRTPGGGQFLISSRLADAKVPFAVM